jgi:hypothetical protein
MAWGEVELEPEVSEWLEGLDDQRWAQAMFHLDLLEDHGVLLGEPYTRQLLGKLRELRFYCGGNGSASPTGSRRDAGSSC